MSDSAPSIFYRSSGLLFGIYLPSDDDVNQGVFMTGQGLFPATLTEAILKFFSKNKKNIQRKHHFYCWVRGLSEAPYYHFYLISRSGTVSIKKSLSDQNFSSAIQRRTQTKLKCTSQE